MLFSTSLSSPLPRFFGTGVARAEVQSEQTAAQAESARTWRENAEGGVYITEVYRGRSGASRLSARESARILLSLSDLPARPAITDTKENLLTRGVEPPRVSPYGPEPYASAIPPRERGAKRLLSCLSPLTTQAKPELAAPPFADAILELSRLARFAER